MREGAFACAYTCVCVVSVCVRVGGVGSGSLRSDKVRRNGTLTRSNLGPLVAK